MTQLAKATLVVLASGTGLALAGLYLFPEKKRVRRRYHDAMLRTTAELPAIETMHEVVYGRKR